MNIILSWVVYALALILVFYFDASYLVGLLIAGIGTMLLRDIKSEKTSFAIYVKDNKWVVNILAVYTLGLVTFIFYSLITSGEVLIFSEHEEVIYLSVTPFFIPFVLHDLKLIHEKRT
ncbi:MAG: hypothetical protein N0C84_20440 [Candidatus Thiodiazotropha taylori]|uniref:Uncharacterized protein n=1 Tax=Candidatus Thiodiazotropha taylori TaxID=2792791 RepID=A0A9E4N752_9GAMM|nr:hypothetical protein [Candidatus Thiodiazotropha taylori]MCW4258838.1 hypothetical protein [Candidatus Thiodiazotropha taylori]